MLDVVPGTIVVYSDLACPWAHVAVYRLRDTRRRLGLDGQVVLDHRAYPLEVFNRRPTPWRLVSAELPVVGGLEPEADWHLWQNDLSTWPVTTLLALEAVQAAKDQGLAASERFDRCLRVAFFGESRCISMCHVVLDVADECGLDEVALADSLDAGRARRAVFAQCEAASGGVVDGSPHVFLADGTEVHNPGVEVEWVGEHGVEFPVISKDDPTVYEELLIRAAEATA